jgi:hypothetical protein
LRSSSSFLLHSSIFLAASNFFHRADEASRSSRPNYAAPPASSPVFFHRADEATHSAPPPNIFPARWMIGKAFQQQTALGLLGKLRFALPISNTSVKS